MANTYIWVIKHLNSDQRGYAQSLYLELEGTNGTDTVTESCVSVFGGSEYKPMNQWTQEQIDAWAEEQKPNLQKTIDSRLELKAKGQ